jgi:hypothetical protein
MPRINVESASSVASDQFSVTIPFRALTAVIISKCVTTSLLCSVPEDLNWLNSAYELAPIAVGNPGLAYGPSTKVLLACPTCKRRLPLSLSQIRAGRLAEMRRATDLPVRNARVSSAPLTVGPRAIVPFTRSPSSLLPPTPRLPASIYLRPPPVISLSNLSLLFCRTQIRQMTMRWPLASGCPYRAYHQHPL